MDPDLLPTLVSYYQQSQCAKEAGHRVELQRHARISQRLTQKLERSAVEQDELRQQIEELKVALAKTQATADVRQQEVESLRARHSDTDKADRAVAHTLKVQADSYKREISELRDDLKMRDEELKDLRDDAIERENDLKTAREATRSRDKEMKDSRDQLRARETEVRKANHLIEKLQVQVQRLEVEVSDGQDALEVMRDALADAEEQRDTLQARKQVAASYVPVARPLAKVTKPAVRRATVREPSPPPLHEISHNDLGAEDESMVASPAPARPKKKAPVVDDSSRNLPEPATDYTEPPSKPTKRPAAKSPAKKHSEQTAGNGTKKNDKPHPSGKENADTKSKAARKRKLADDFSASPPRSSPPPASPKRKQTKKPDFSMTPFVDKTKKNALSLIPLSPPSSRAVARELSSATDRVVPLKDDEAKPKKKRKLLGGAKTLMDDTPKKAAPKKATKINFGKELSPLKRPVGGAGLIIRD